MTFTFNRNVHSFHQQHRQDVENTEMHTSTKISLQTSSNRERSKHEIQSLVRITTVHSGPLSIYTERREKKREVRGKRREKSVPIFTVLEMHEV